MLVNLLARRCGSNLAKETLALIRRAHQNDLTYCAMLTRRMKTNIRLNIVISRRAVFTSAKVSCDKGLNERIAPKSEIKVERVLTIPNVLTMSRIALTPVISYLLLSDQHAMAIVLTLVAGFSDFLDGYIARKFPSQQSALGSIIDPLADKIFVCTLTITLTQCGLLPLELMSVILVRDLGLIFASLIVRYRMIDEPKTLWKFLNIKNKASVQVEASFISKLNTVFQIALIGLTIPSGLFAYNDSIFLRALQYLTAATTISSGFLYLVKGGSYKIIK
jgi:cardiolipin synthase (CMP-forming)